MNRRAILLTVIGVALLVLAPLAWWLAAPLWTNRTVDEAFPVAAAGQAASADLPIGPATAATGQTSTTQPVPPLLVATSTVTEPITSETTSPLVVAQGEFQDADTFHQGSGQAIIYQVADGSRVLRFENFTVTNGPDLHVLLATNPTPGASSELGDYLDLGSLKGNVGNQNYEIPADVDLSQYGSIVIYCKPFHVIFSVATFQ
jgi:hypothetical protein